MSRDLAFDMGWAGMYVHMVSLLFLLFRRNARVMHLLVKTPESIASLKLERNSPKLSTHTTLQNLSSPNRGDKRLILESVGRFPTRGQGCSATGYFLFRHVCVCGIELCIFF